MPFSYRGLRSVSSNVIWLFADKGLRASVGLLVNALVARYLGPADFGELSYIIAFVLLLKAVARLGLDGVVVRDISRSSSDASLVLGIVSRLRFLAGVILWLVSVFAVLIYRPGDLYSLQLVAIASGVVVLDCFETIDLWFQSNLESKRTVISRGIAYVGASLVKLWLIAIEAPLIAFILIFLFEAGVASAVLYFNYVRSRPVRSFAWSNSKAILLLKESWPYLLASLGIVIYTKTDLVMLKQMSGSTEVGIYSAALPLSTVWYFLPTAICTSMAPVLSKQKEVDLNLYQKTIEKLFSMMWLVLLPICLLISMSSSFVINTLYGAEYSSSAIVLSIHVFSNIFVSLGIVQGKWILNERMGHMSLYKSLLGALSNIVLNLLLIPRYSYTGAAIATTVSIGIASVFSNTFFAPHIFFMQISSIFKMHKLIISR